MSLPNASAFLKNFSPLCYLVFSENPVVFAKTFLVICCVSRDEFPFTTSTQNLKSKQVSISEREFLFTSNYPFHLLLVALTSICVKLP